MEFLGEVRVFENIMGHRPKKANGLFVHVEGILSKNQAKKKDFQHFQNGSTGHKGPLAGAADTFFP